MVFKKKPEPEKITYFNPPIKGKLDVSLELGEQDDDGFFMPTLTIKEGTEVTILGQFVSEDYITGRAFIIYYDHEITTVDVDLINHGYTEKLEYPTTYNDVYLEKGEGA